MFSISCEASVIFEHLKSRTPEYWSSKSWLVGDTRRLHAWWWSLETSTNKQKIHKQTKTTANQPTKTFVWSLFSKYCFSREVIFSVLFHGFGICCTVRATFEADLGSCQLTAKWTRLLPLGNCVESFRVRSCLLYWLFSLWFWNSFGQCTLSCWANNCKLLEGAKQLD